MARTAPKISALNLARYLQLLGSVEPAPGGGAAAALTLAQSAALAEMVSRLNAQRKIRKDENPSNNLRRASFFSHHRNHFLKLLTQDIQAFQKLSSIPKEKRGGALHETALKNAALAPMEMCVRAEQLTGDILLESRETNSWLFSDIEEASILLYAGFRSARLNVEINLRLLRDKGFVKRSNTHLAKIDRLIKSLEARVKKEGRSS